MFFYLKTTFLLETFNLHNHCIQKKASLSRKQGFFCSQTRLVFTAKKPCFQTEEKGTEFQCVTNAFPAPSARNRDMVGNGREKRTVMQEIVLFFLKIY